MPPFMWVPHLLMHNGHLQGFHDPNKVYMGINIFIKGSCNTPVLTPWYLIVHDVNIVWKSWRGAQGQGPAIVWCFLDRRSRLIPMVLVLSQTLYILIYHGDVQINIIPQLAMGLQTLKRWGHDSTRYRVGRCPIDSRWEIVGSILTKTMFKILCCFVTQVTQEDATSELNPFG